MKNKALAHWKAGRPSPGAWISLSEVHLAENLSRMGFDWLCFDLQHGLLDMAHLLTLLPAVTGAATPLVRVTTNDAAEIGRALDIGAHGVIVPMVCTPEEAAQAAAACRYPPQGVRSCGPIRGIMFDGFGYLGTANAEVACIVMIETLMGLENVEAIAETPGIDALFIGPIDLSFALGLPPTGFQDERFTAAVARIRAACVAAGRAVGIYGYSPALARQALADGFNFASVGSDLNFLREGATTALSQVQGPQEITTPTQGARY